MTFFQKEKEKKEQGAPGNIGGTIFGVLGCITGGFGPNVLGNDETGAVFLQKKKM